MKSIVFITGSQSRTGGTERVCADLCNNLAQYQDNYKLTILSLSKGKVSSFPVDNRVILEELTDKQLSGYINNLYLSFLLTKYVIKNKPNIIVGVESLIFLNMIFTRFLPNRPKLICWEHFNIKVNLNVQLRDYARSLATILADKIVVLSREDKKYWLDKFPNINNKLIHIFNPNPFEKVIKNTAGRKPKKIILAAGRLTYQKGFDLLLESWSKIPITIRDKWTLKIAGEGEDRVKLEKLIKQHDLADSVVLLGHCKNISKEYEAASIFALSSRFEGFGLVLLEALSYQLPIVSFKCPAGPSEIIFDGINGFLIENGNIQGFSEKLISLMQDETLLLKMKNNTKYHLDRFDGKSIAEKWTTLFNELIESNYNLDKKS